MKSRGFTGADYGLSATAISRNRPTFVLVLVLVLDPLPHARGRKIENEDENEDEHDETRVALGRLGLYAEKHAWKFLA